MARKAYRVNIMQQSRVYTQCIHVHNVHVHVHVATYVASLIDSTVSLPVGLGVTNQPINSGYDEQGVHLLGCASIGVCVYCGVHLLGCASIGACLLGCGSIGVCVIKSLMTEQLATLLLIIEPYVMYMYVLKTCTCITLRNLLHIP